MSPDGQTTREEQITLLGTNKRTLGSSDLILIESPAGEKINK